MKRFESLNRRLVKRGRSVVTALSVAVLTIILASPLVSPAQTVSVNGSSTSCVAGTTQLLMDQSGNMTITCTVSGVTVFSCVASLTTVQSGSTATTPVSIASCNGSVAAYTWGTLPTGITAATTASGQSFMVNVPSGLASNTSYSFPVMVTPVSGSTWSGNATLNVTAAAGSGGTGGTGGGTTGCSSTNGTLAKNSTTSITLQQGQSASYAINNTLNLPLITSYGANFRFSTIYGSNPAQETIGVQYAISTCQGDFSANVPPGCSGWSSVGSGILDAAVGAAAAARNGTGCVIQPSPTQYYVNIRLVNQDLVTPSCPVSNCQFVLQGNYTSPK